MVVGRGGGGTKQTGRRGRIHYSDPSAACSSTFHLSACEMEPLPVLHIYCDPITLPHIQASDESCCFASAILKRGEEKNLTIYHLCAHTHTYADIHLHIFIATPTRTHPHTAAHTHTVQSYLLTFLCVVPCLIVHAR